MPEADHVTMGREGVQGTCKSLSFKALMLTQLLGALNDNLFKLIVSLMIVTSYVTSKGGTIYLGIAQALFILPNILFSPYAGFLADRFSKTAVIRVVKAFEAAIMACAFLLFVHEQIFGLLFVLFLMGLHSTMFSPAKYGIMPELLEERELSRGNGYLEFFTFIAIIAGTSLSGMLEVSASGGHARAGSAVLTVAVVGFLSSLFIRRMPVANPHKAFELNPFKELWVTLREIRSQRALYLCLLAISYFWAVGVFFQMNILLFAKEHLQVGEFHTSVLLACFGLGIGAGSIAAGVVSRGKVELGLVPLGSLGIMLFGLLLAASYNSFYATAGSLFFFGVSSGFFIVPLNSFFQHDSPAESRGRYLAAQNFVSYLWMLGSAGITWALKDVLHLTPSQLFMAVGLLSLGVAVWICRVLPEALVRCVNWVLANVLYQTRIIGVENVPKSGGALLVANHVSYADPPLLLASLERPVRFIMYRPIYDHPVINPVAKLLRAIPIAPEDKPKELLKALAQAREAVLAGELVCIFAEGALTRIGNLLPFGKGLERIMKGVDAPIIPIYLDQIWGSIFSFKNGRFFWKVPREVPYPVTIRFGKAVSGASKTHEVRQAIQQLSAESFQYRTRHHKLLHQGFLRTAKRFPFRTCLTDTSGKRLSYFSTLASSLSFARALCRHSARGEMIGVMLPPSVGAVLANLSILLAGRVPININFTSGKEAMASAARQCEIRSVVTSRAFLEKASVEAPGEPLYLEDFAWVFEKRRVFLHSALALLPSPLLLRMFGGKGLSPDDTATVIFSSGSTGEPKGVMLSHANISTNIESLYEVFQIDESDCVVGVLPLFHSFGFSGTMWLPLLAGIKAAYHASPLDAGRIGDLIEKERGTIFLTTPTFMLSIIRKCGPEQLRTLRYLVVGAEKLKTKIAQAFTERFGVVPLEGYGATELSPVAMLNVPDAGDEMVRQIGHKPGTVGHPIPGVAALIVDPDTYAPLSPGESGLLLIKGGNVMKGYLGNPTKTAEVIRDGWYVTGDVAQLDEDGFVTITDRLSRFSKIGGEMVPHVKVEEEIQKLVGGVEQAVVVTAIPDEKKGEKLIVLTVREFDPGEIVKKLTDSGLSNLWIPKRENFHRIDSFPMLGTGKLDLKAVKRLAERFDQERSG